MEARKRENAGTCNPRHRPVMNIDEDTSSLVLRRFVFDVVWISLQYSAIVQWHECNGSWNAPNTTQMQRRCQDIQRFLTFCAESVVLHNDFSIWGVFDAGRFHRSTCIQIHSQDCTYALYLSILFYLHVQLSNILDPFTHLMSSSLFHRRIFSYLVGTDGCISHTIP